MNEEELNSTESLEQAPDVPINNQEQLTLELDYDYLNNLLKPTVTETEPQPEEQPTQQPEEQTEADPNDPPLNPFTAFYGGGPAFGGKPGDELLGESIGQGFVDFTSDLVNQIPGIDTQKPPPSTNKINQTVREISSIVGPMLLIRGVAGAGVKGLQAKNVGTPALKQLGKNNLFKWFSEWGLDIGVGVFVDKVASIQETDHNLAGALKESWPDTYKWIPEGWATNDDDGPDTKEAKNITEGVALGSIGHLFHGLAKVVDAGASVFRATKWVPKNEKATEFFSNVKQLDELSDSPLEDTVIRGAASQEAALDEMGQFKMNSDIDLDQPTKGVHDLYDVNELGLRSVDVDGVPGVTVDTARIFKNIDTQHGRLGSMFTEAALEEGLQPQNLTKRFLVKQIKEQITSMGEYDAVTAAGRKLPWKDIDTAGTRLAEIMLDPTMEPGMLKEVLSEFKNIADGLEYIDDVGYDAAFKSINKYLDEYLNMDVLKAQAYLNTSLAGQVSDLAQGARLVEGTAAVEAAQEQILKRVKYLMVEKGLSSWQRGSGLSNINVWKRIRVLNDPKALEELSEQATLAHTRKMDSIIPEVDQFIETLENISKERPAFLKPLLLALEFSDGNINSMHKVNDAVEKSLQVWKKAFIDGSPEIPSVVMKSVWSNYFNSILSSTGTFFRASIGNAGGLLGKIGSTFVGGVLHRDLDVLKHGFAQFSAVNDTMEKGLVHWGKVFRKAATDPNDISYIVMDDLNTIQNAKKLEFLNSFADAAELEGEYGPKYLMQRVNDMEALANSPWFRYGANGMTASDGFTRAVVGNWKARGDVWLDSFKEGKVFTKKDFREASNKLYEGMFNKKGFIEDDQVKYASQEIALNLDNPATQSISTLIRHVPAIRAFVTFPKTTINMGQAFHRWGPTNLFAGDWNNIVKRPLESFSIDEISTILESKGIPVDQHALMRFKTLRAEITGKVAIGSTILGLGFNMALSDRLHGNGHWDQAIQRSRGPKWQRRAFKGLDGRWHSGEFLGPLGDWVFLAADLVDNFDQISESAIENAGQKLMFVLAASLTGKSVLSNLEPLLDVLQGNSYAFNRWSAGIINGSFPFAGARNDLNKLLSPELRILDLDVFSQLRNRNNWLDIIDESSKVPESYDWVDGGKIGVPDNMITRLSNAFTPFKTTGKTTPERQFLEDIEFDARPTLSKSSGGVGFTPSEQAELLSMIGEDEVFKRELQGIMRRSEAIKFVETLREFRRSGISSERVDTEKWENIHVEINEALRTAMRIAVSRLSTYDRVQQAEFELRRTAYENKAGIPPVTENNPLTMRNK